MYSKRGDSHSHPPTHTDSHSYTHTLTHTLSNTHHDDHPAGFSSYIQLFLKDKTLEIYTYKIFYIL